MPRYIDADALIQLGLQDGAYEYVSVQEIADFPTADVVSKEKYDELNDRYHRLLENANILADEVRDYERREDERKG